MPAANTVAIVVSFIVMVSSNYMGRLPVWELVSGVLGGCFQPQVLFRPRMDGKKSLEMSASRGHPTPQNQMVGLRFIRLAALKVSLSDPPDAEKANARAARRR